ncbi:MAG: DNA-directed DNA polymerase II small subunit [Candidatus Micrarchaeia archaeon]
MEYIKHAGINKDGLIKVPEEKQASIDFINYLVKKLDGSMIIVPSSLDTSIISDVEKEALAARILKKYEGIKTPKILTNEDLKEVSLEIKSEKIPIPVEIRVAKDFKPQAAEVEAEYEVTNKFVNKVHSNTEDFVKYFRDRLSKIKSFFSSHEGLTGVLQNLDVVNSYTTGREITVAGIVSKKIVTKKGNIMIILEDETAEVKVIFSNGSNQKAQEAFASASTIIEDEVIALKGKIVNPFIIASEIIYPDVPIKEKKLTKDDLAIAFISDVHVGSKLFLSKNFYKFIEWLNGDSSMASKELAGKVKYLVVAGDIVDGIGVYPGQEKDLEISDVYQQYKTFFELIDQLPEYINVFVLPGNHDASQLAEPQPPFDSLITKYTSNPSINFVSNPAYIKMHGISVLAYHGASIDSIIRTIPNLSYAKPENAMIEILKRRHLSPVYGINPVMPSETDQMVINPVPDILHMGHVHKNGLAEYHGVSIVNSGTWQARTDYQIKLGHVPSPGVVPIYETKTGKFRLVDFHG